MRDKSNGISVRGRAQQDQQAANLDSEMGGQAAKDQA